MNMVLFTA